jgi:hypothetical protein
VTHQHLREDKWLGGHVDVEAGAGEGTADMQPLKPANRGSDAVCEALHDL